MTAKFSKTEWWWICHLAEAGRRRTFPPVQPYDRRDYAAVEKLIRRGILVLIKRDAEGRIFFQPDRRGLREALESGGGS